MKILVPVKRVADPANANRMKISADGKNVDPGNLPWAVNPFDDYALEAALRLTENADKNERIGEVVVVSIGPEDVQTTMQTPLAMGADRGILIKTEEGTLDSWVVANLLLAVIKEEKPDLVLMGKQAADGESNTVGQILAELAELPMATFAMSIDAAADGKTVVVGRELDNGVLKLKVELPAVVTVDTRIVTPQAVKNNVTGAAYAYPVSDTGRIPSIMGIRNAKKKPFAVKTPAELGVNVTSNTTYDSFELPPARSGSARYVESVDELMGILKNEVKMF